MKSPVVVAVLVLALSGVAPASELSLCNQSDRGLIGCAAEKPRFTLVDYHSATVVPVPVPYASPVVHARTDFFLLGLGLVGAGLVLGGAGFLVLYMCRAPSGGDPGGSCYSSQDSGKTSNTIGLVLAAPGIIPLAIGALIIYSFTGSRYRAALEPADTGMRWVLTAMPLNGGGMVGGAFQF